MSKNVTKTLIMRQFVSLQANRLFKKNLKYQYNEIAKLSKFVELNQNYSSPSFINREFIRLYIQLSSLWGGGGVGRGGGKFENSP